MPRKLSEAATKEPVESIADLQADKTVVEAMRIIRDEPRLEIDTGIVERVRRMRVFSKLDKATGRWMRTMPTAVVCEDDLLPVSEAYHREYDYREQLADIGLKVGAIKHDLDRMWNELFNYLRDRGVVAQAKTISDRKALFEVIVAPLADRLRDAKYVLEACERKTGEMKEAYYAIKEIQKIGMIKLGLYDRKDN